MLAEIEQFLSPQLQDRALSGLLWWFFVLWFAALGGCVGSFLNVCWDRRGTGRGIVFPPSECDDCGQSIRWYDNIPVLGWLLLRGRCRRCGASIPVKHVLVESAFALLFMSFAVVILSSDLLKKWL